MASPKASDFDIDAAEAEAMADNDESVGDKVVDAKESESDKVVDVEQKKDEPLGLEADDNLEVDEADEPAAKKAKVDA